MSANNSSLKSMHLVANILLVVSIALFGMMILLLKQERQNPPSNAVRQCYTNKNSQSDCYRQYRIWATCWLSERLETLEINAG